MADAFGLEVLFHSNEFGGHLLAGPAQGFRHHNPFAYPVNTRGKPEAVAAILEWAAARGVVGVGRWGRWDHMNSDVAVSEALAAADALAGGGAAR